MNICIDVGNTLTKIAVFKDEEIVHSEKFEDVSIAEFKQICKKYNIKNGIVSSVKEDNTILYNELKHLLKRLIILDSETKIPIENRYKSPKTLGKDRLAVVIGANYLYPGKDILVIDAGSAITFDFINEKGEYIGGNIAPGLSMRFKALHEYTSKLPLLSPQDDYLLLGTNTNEAIIAGVQNSILFETETYINELGKVYGGLITLITGGDAFFFENKLNNTIQVVPNLVVIGLNRILNFNG
jgi:type III pantothenate kinase